MPEISLRVNGKARVVDPEPDVPLLYVLQNDLELNGLFEKHQAGAHDQGGR